MPFASKFSMSDTIFFWLCFDGKGPFYLYLLNIINKTSCRISEHLNSTESSYCLNIRWRGVGFIREGREVLRVFTKGLEILVSIMSAIDFMK